MHLAEKLKLAERIASGMQPDATHKQVAMYAIDILESLAPEVVRKDYPPQHANEDGWTDWISPTDIDLYGLQCCDCKMKHEMQFRVLRNKAYTDGEKWYADPVPAEEGYHVAFRMRREPQNDERKP